MEGRSHNNKSYAVAGQVSRMARDFQICSDDFKSSFKPRPAERHRASLPQIERKQRLRVCVVGAGLAGLRFAQLLVDEGIDVTVFEARERIGGRVHQDVLEGALVDMGPNWVHGTESNPIVRLAADVGTKTSALGEETQVHAPSGEPVDNDRATKLNDMIWDIISDAFEYSNKHCEDIPPHLSLKHFFQAEPRITSLSEDDQVLILQMAEKWGSFIGDRWEKQSLKWFRLEECLDGENLSVVDTHTKIIDEISRNVWEHADVQLGARVAQIENLESVNGDPKVGVTVQQSGHEKVFDFDEVIVAIPLGFLKRNMVTFSPALPSDIRYAVDNASISTLEKVYVTFPGPFWDTMPSGIRIVADGSHTCSPDAEEYFPGFSDFLNPSYAPKSHQSWALEVNPLSNPHVFGDAARPILLFTLFGDSSRELTSAPKPYSPSDQRYLHIVIDFTEPYYSRLPNYEKANPKCTPSAVLATNWQNDDLAGNGSYTNFQVSDVGKTVVLDEEVRAMRRGMPERGIWLAGEHTAPFVGLGTSTGAYWSGESVAMRILAANGLAEPSGYVERHVRS